jgi:hypothetical protein
LVLELLLEQVLLVVLVLLEEQVLLVELVHM